MEALTVFFVVAALAANVACAWLTISVSADGKRRTESALKEMSVMLTKSNPNTYRAVLDDLGAAIEQLRSSNRRELGALWGRLGGRRPAADGADVPTVDLDEMMRLQSAPPAKTQ